MKNVAEKFNECLERFQKAKIDCSKVVISADTLNNLYSESDEMGTICVYPKKCPELYERKDELLENHNIKCLEDDKNEGGIQYDYQDDVNFGGQEVMIEIK